MATKGQARRKAQHVTLRWRLGAWRLIATEWCFDYLLPDSLSQTACNGGETPPIPMETDAVSQYTGKRKSDELEHQQETNQDATMANTDSEKENQKILTNKQDPEPEKKKRYGGNAVRRSKTLLRIDFPNATKKRTINGLRY